MYVRMCVYTHTRMQIWVSFEFKLIDDELIAVVNQLTDIGPNAVFITTNDANDVSFRN